MARMSASASWSAGEELLRHNGISYTVVRPGGLKNMPGGQEHIIAGEFMSPATPAALLIAAVGGAGACA